jgi:hypothetical protein
MKSLKLIKTKNLRKLYNKKPGHERRDTQTKWGPAVQVV